MITPSVCWLNSTFTVCGFIHSLRGGFVSVDRGSSHLSELEHLPAIPWGIVIRRLILIMMFVFLGGIQKNGERKFIFGIHHEFCPGKTFFLQGSGQAFSKPGLNRLSFRAKGRYKKRQSTRATPSTASKYQGQGPRISSKLAEGGLWRVYK